jgi:hypothetical protein
MAFLYSTYIIVYSIADPFLSRHINHVFHATGSIRSSRIYTAAVQLTVIFVIMFAATFIPKRSMTFNPTIINDDDQESATVSDVDQPLTAMSTKDKQEVRQ